MMLIMDTFYFSFSELLLYGFAFFASRLILIYLLRVNFNKFF